MVLEKLKDQLDALDPHLRQRLDARGFDAHRLLDWAASLGSETAERNRLRGEVRPVPTDQIPCLPARGTSEHERLAARGRAELAAGRVAVCVLAGGMATRMGGVVKGLLDALPQIRFLDLRLAEIDQLAQAYGAAPPFWLMTSEPTNGPLRAALGPRCDGRQVDTFEQLVSLRLDPRDGLFFGDDGKPSVYATGHGDLPEALNRSSLLDDFRERGGTTVWINNLDNLGASVDEAVLGYHATHGGPLTVELARKHPGDKGGGPVLLDGRPIVAEDFRVPADFDHDAVEVFNTNTFLVDADALGTLALEWTYLEVHKQVDGRTAVQFERLIGEMTVALAPALLEVPREGEHGRFLPIKTYADLAEARPRIEQIARRRGLLG